MDVKLSFNGKANPKCAYDLDELANMLNKSDINEVVPNQIIAAGIKDGGLTIGLTIVGLALTAIGTFISVLSYWESKKPDYNITLTYGDISFTVNNLSNKQMQELANSIRSANQLEQIDISISRK